MTRPNGLTTTYEYDAMNRLIQKVESQPGPISTLLASLTLTRDALGRMTVADRRAPLMPGVTETDSTGWAYDDASQITTYTYDAMGRVTNDGVRTYVWDGASRPMTYTEGPFTES